MSNNLEQVVPPDRVPFHALADGFQQALVSGAELHQLMVVIAGLPVSIRVIGDAWFDMVQRATHHLVRFKNSDDAVLHIDAWDEHATGVRIKRKVLPTDAPLVVMKMSEDGMYVGEERRHTTLWMDRSSARIIGCTQTAERLNLDERARPFHKLLSHWLEERNVQFLHAGLVSHNDAGLLFVGNGGAGKSTSSICCLRAGMGYLGDDFVGFSQDGQEFTGHGLYASCLLDSHHLQRFPDLIPLAHAPHFESEHKHVLYLDQHFSGSLKVSQTITGLVLPRVVDSETTSFEPASRMQGLRALAPTSVMYLARPNRAAFDRISALVESVPSFWLNLGRDVSTIAPSVRALAASIANTKHGDERGSD